MLLFLLHFETLLWSCIAILEYKWFRSWTVTMIVMLVCHIMIIFLVNLIPFQSYSLLRSVRFKAILRGLVLREMLLGIKIIVYFLLLYLFSKPSFKIGTRRLITSHLVSSGRSHHLFFITSILSLTLCISRVGIRVRAQ